MEHNDTSWCPACDRHIQQKRTQVPVLPPTPPAPPPPPSSPQSPSPTRRTKTGTIRQRGGLVQGTGRVKPNGSLKRADSKPQPPTQPPAPIKYRTVIDQGPTLLYCSDECRMADIHNNHGVVPHDYHPDRQELSPSPVPFSRRTVDSDSTGSSIESQSSISSASSSQPTTHSSPSLATLAALYNWGPPPPPAHVDENTECTVDYQPHDYSSGVMMAARRISEFCPKPQKRTANGHIVPTEPRKPIPGWTDGSNAWRSSIYSFASPRHSPHEELKAYKSFTASSHRSRGVQSTIGSSTASASRATTSSLPTDSTEMINKFSESFTRRSESRTALYSGASSPTVGSFPSTAPTRRERSLLQPGAEGKLLVPDVKLKVHSGSSTSLSSAWSPSSRRSSVRSPLSFESTISDDESTQRCDSAASLPLTMKRPTVETRSWSYDNVRTYPVMRMPQKTVKRMEKRVVDGVETEVEVEVVVDEPLKRLFLFPASTRA
ncbi:hypothetical protein BDZ94DRAFT_1279631 [Collybia nuda]|uniref:Uncharacterized protein n=1 Tax=Collybia nuda TaxID=64659 RepID=A0A9P5YEJ0_9AGAR|nr:hypothetical protein BDZ94DRAFT_1279631 [Collybia nuda]